MTDSNAALADRWGNDDEHAFASLVDRYHAVVFRVCMRILNHEQDAEDATQETFSRLAKYLDRWDRRRPIEPWLVTIARNRSRTFLASRKIHDVVATDIEIEEPNATRFDSAIQLREELALALSELPQTYRIAFKMFHQQGMGYAEISQQLRRPEGTIKTWVHRARHQLIDHLRRREVAQPSVRTDIHSRESSPHPIKPHRSTPNE